MKFEKLVDCVGNVLFTLMAVGFVIGMAIWSMSS